MKTHATMVQTLEAAILAESQREIREMMAEAEIEARRIRQTSQAEIAKLQQTIIQRAQREADSLLEHTTAAAQMEAQTLKLQRREQIINNVFDTVLQKLPDIAATPQYRGIAHYLLQEAILGLRVDYLIVHADEVTRAYLDVDTITEFSIEFNCGLEMGTSLTEGTGIIVETKDGRRRYDNTLETRLERMRNTLRTPIYQRLMGGKH
jgi:vacuolar-type H+-ATPase subunit E/Vma4